MISEATIDRAIVSAPSGAVAERQAARFRLASVPGANPRLAALRLFWDGVPELEPAGQAGLVGAALQSVPLCPRHGVPLADAVAALGVTLTAGVSRSSAFVDLFGLRTGIQEALALVGEALRDGVGDGAAWNAGRAKSQHALRQRELNQRTRATDALLARRAVPGSALARPAEGTAEDLRALTVEQGRWALRQLLGQRLNVVAVGVEPTDGDLTDLTTTISSGDGTAAPTAPGDVLTADRSPELWLKSRRDGEGYLLWGTVTALSSPAELAALQLAARMLGGWYGARWWRHFRDTRAVTYGTDAGVETCTSGPGLFGTLYVGMVLAPRDLRTARSELLASADEFVDEITPAELNTAAVQLLCQETFWHDGVQGLAQRTSQFLMGGLPGDFNRSRLRALRTMSLPELRTLLRRLLGNPLLVTIAAEAAR